VSEAAFQRAMQVVKETGKMVNQITEASSPEATHARGAYRDALERALSLATTDSMRETIESLLKTDAKAAVT